MCLSNWESLLWSIAISSCLVSSHSFLLQFLFNYNIFVICFHSTKIWWILLQIQTLLNIQQFIIISLMTNFDFPNIFSPILCHFFLHTTAYNFRLCASAGIEQVWILPSKILNILQTLQKLKNLSLYIWRNDSKPNTLCHWEDGHSQEHSIRNEAFRCFETYQ
jgi:hypothetical protein